MPFLVHVGGLSILFVTMSFIIGTLLTELLKSTLQTLTVESHQSDISNGFWNAERKQCCHVVNKVHRLMNLLSCL